MKTSSQKTALVTGASRGIGAQIATRLASDGFAVIVNYANSKGQAEALVAKIKDAGGQATAAQADVSQPSDAASLFDLAEETYGSVDVLVNNAGILKMTSLAKTSDDDFEKQIQVNLKGSFNTMREAATRLNENGRIINLSTSVVGLSLPTYSVYAATKAAVETMTKILSKEMRGRNICVNAVAPGPTATDLFLDGKSEETVTKLANMAPLERLGEPEDIAAVVSFLAGPDGKWVNGQVLRANGGIV